MNETNTTQAQGFVIITEVNTVKRWNLLKDTSNIEKNYEFAMYLMQLFESQSLGLGSGVKTESGAIPSRATSTSVGVQASFQPSVASRFSQTSIEVRSKFTDSSNLVRLRTSCSQTDDVITEGNQSDDIIATVGDEMGTAIPLEMISIDVSTLQKLCKTPVLKISRWAEVQKQNSCLLDVIENYFDFDKLDEAHSATDDTCETEFLVDIDHVKPEFKLNVSTDCFDLGVACTFPEQTSESQWRCSDSNVFQNPGSVCDISIDNNSSAAGLTQIESVPCVDHESDNSNLTPNLEMAASRRVLRPRVAKDVVSVNVDGSNKKINNGCVGSVEAAITSVLAEQSIEVDEAVSDDDLDIGDGCSTDDEYLPEKDETLKSRLGTLGDSDIEVQCNGKPHTQFDADCLSSRKGTNAVTGKKRGHRQDERVTKQKKSKLTCVPSWKEQEYKMKRQNSKEKTANDERKRRSKEKKIKSKEKKRNKEKKKKMAAIQSKMTECQFCFKQFGNPNQLTLHESRHKQSLACLRLGAACDVLTKPKICKVCNKQFNALKLRVHLLTHKRVRVIKCDGCCKAFTNHNILMNHQKFHKFCCQYCKKAFCSRKSQQAHLVLRHGSAKPFKCKYCVKRFGQPFSALKHEHSHSIGIPLAPIICRLCRMPQLTPTGYKKHFKSTHGFNKPYECDICSFVCATRRYLKKHRNGYACWIYANSDPCSDCNKTALDFNTFRSFTDHKFRHYRIQYNVHRCTFCETVYETNLELTKHLGLKHKDKKLFKCKVCYSRFSQFSSLRQHLSNAQLKGKHFIGVKCTFCDVSIKKSFMKDHLETVHDRRQFDCTICPKRCSNAKSFVLHQQWHQFAQRLNLKVEDGLSTLDGTYVSLTCPKGTRYIYFCKLCQNCYRNNDLFRHHMLKRHNECKAFQCPDCLRKFANQQTLYSHAKSHKFNKRLFPCTDCNKSFLIESEFIAHCNATHKQEMTNFECPFCEERFVHTLLLGGHLRQNHSEQQPDLRIFKCAPCKVKFSYFIKFIDHVIDKHDAETKCKCDICGEEFANYLLLKCHSESNHKPPINCYTCKLCSKTFSLRGTFLAHLNLELLKRECNICKQMIPKSKWRGHKILCGNSRTKICKDCHTPRKKGFHNCKKPEVCEICGKVSNTRHLARLHRFTHRPKTVSCLKCAKLYSSKDAMTVHMNTAHSVLRFTCDICSKKFKLKHQLHNHLISHQEEHQFKCSKCPKTFKYPHNYKNHIKLHTE